MHVLNKDQFKREQLYQMTMTVASDMLRKGLISEDDYSHIDTMFRQKYRPVFGSLCGC